MTSFRMRHANGLAELAAQMERHFLTAPAQRAQQTPGHEQLAQQGTTAQLAALLHAYAPAGAGQAAGPPPAVADPGSPPSPPGTALLEELSAASPVQEAAGAPGPEPPAGAGSQGQEPAGEPASPGGTQAAQGPVPEAGAGAPPGQASEGGSQQQQEQQRRRFAASTYLSQLQQGLAYQTAVHQWRRNKVDPAAQVGGHML